MKIRTRLMLFLLPTLLGSLALVVTLLAMRWQEDILSGFHHNLRSAAVSAAAMPSHDEREFHRIATELELTSLAFVPLEKQLPRGDFSHIVQVRGVDGVLTGHIVAGGDVDLMKQKFRESLLLVLVSGSLAASLLIVTLYVMAGRIALPIQKLNNAALAIAAGQYGEAAPIGGPKEITDLGHTLNTMRECLLENIDRLKENALFRERMYGEYECAMLLQHMMLQKNIDECESDAVAVKSLTFFSDSPRGFLLNFPTKSDQLFHIHIAEAEDTGFEGMYELVTQYKHAKDIAKHTSLTFHPTSGHLQWQGTHRPILWSLDHKQFIEPTVNETPLEAGDFFFLCNEGLDEFFREDRQTLRGILSKVLKIFAQDGLETTSSMLQKELRFAVKRKELTEDIHLLCFQVLYPR